MSTTYFFNSEGDVYGINQNTTLYAQNLSPVNENEYDYVITLPINMNSQLFSTKTYQQNASNADLYDVVLTLDQGAFNTAYDTSAMVNDKSDLGQGIMTTEKVEVRILEILALKIFGHARARAAIANDNTITNSIKSDLFNHLNNVVQAHKNDIFNQYAQLDLVEMNANDVNATVNFNFDADTLAFPGFLNGSLSGVPDTISADLANGPAEGNGGNQLINGLYNVPILFKFTT